MLLKDVLCLRSKKNYMSADERIALLYPYNLVQFSFEMK